MKSLKDLSVGDTVWCGGDSGFCRSSIEVVMSLYKRYDGITGEPYTVIGLSGDRLFDSRDGYAMTPPLAYRIEAIAQA